MTVHKEQCSKNRTQHDTTIKELPCVSVHIFLEEETRHIDTLDGFKKMLKVVVAQCVGSSLCTTGFNVERAEGMAEERANQSLKQVRIDVYRRLFDAHALHLVCRVLVSRHESQSVRITESMQNHTALCGVAMWCFVS